MTEPLVEKERRCFPCPIHRDVETSKTYDAKTEQYLVTCPVCGVIGRFDK